MEKKRGGTVGQKIAAGFLLGTIVTLIIGIIGLVSVQTLNKSLNAMGKIHQPRSSALEDLNSLRLRAQLTIIQALYSQDKIDYIDRLENVRQQRVRIFANIDKTWEAMGEIPFTTTEGIALFEILQNEYGFWRIAHTMLDQYIAMLIDAKPGRPLDETYTEFAALQDRTEPVSNAFNDALENLRRRNLERIEEVIGENSRLSADTQLQMLCFIFAGISIAILLSIVVTNLITVPVRKALDILTALSTGIHIKEIKVEGNDEIAQMIRLLQNEISAKIKAEDSSRSKVEFLAIASHEMRTPLNAILGFTEVQLQNYLSNRLVLSDETVSALKKIKESGKNLLSIVNGILDISKIDMGNLELNLCNYDLASMLNDLIQTYRDAGKERGIEFTVEISDNIPAVLYGDSVRIKQILDNILSNAFKFTEKGFVKLELAMFKLGNGAFITFDIFDSGIGIKESDINNIFRDFRQIDSGIQRKAEGIGLGLAVSKRLATLMGGTITCESGFGKGSKFSFQVPQRFGNGGNISAETLARLRSLRPVSCDDIEYRQETGSRRGRVLVVDDIETNIDVVKGMISLYNMDVDGVLSGADAVKAIEKQEPRYDVIFMDHMMPEMNGIEATALIRKLDTNYARTIPIIALTANTMAESEKMFIEAGLNAYLAKPLDIERLDKEMEKLGRYRTAPIQLDLYEEDTIFSNLNINGMDFADGIKRFGSIDMYKNILQSFTQNTPNIVEKIKAIMASGINPAAGGGSDYSILVHGIKGSARAIGGELVGNMAEELEKAAKSGNKDLVLEKNTAFITEIENLVARLREAVSQTETVHKEQREKPDITLLKRLADACDNYDVVAIDSTIQELEKYEYAEGGSIVEFIREQVDNYEFAAISEKIHTCT